MPGFGAIQLAFGGLDYPAEEEIMVSNDGDDSIKLENFPIKDAIVDINLLYANGTNFKGIGKDADELLRTDNDGSITFSGGTDSYFVVSWSDGRDAESYLMKAVNWKIEDSTNKTTFQYYEGEMGNGGSWTDAKIDRESGDTFSIGNAELAVGAINKLAKTVAITNNSIQTNFNMLYSDEGLEVYLPYDSYTSGTGYINLTGLPNSITQWSLVLDEEDKDGDKGDGDAITATIGLNTQSPKEVSVTGVSGGEAGEQEIGDTDVFRNFVYSALATEILYDKGPDQKTLKLIYHGDEVAADVYITSADAIIGGGSAGVMTYKDTEVSKAAGMNLVVVGGSAINSVAAELLGGSYSESAFTTATNVGAGEFLIQSFNRGGKTALLVAGYNAADTQKAAAYL